MRHQSCQIYYYRIRNFDGDFDAISTSNRKCPLVLVIWTTCFEWRYFTSFPECIIRPTDHLPGHLLDLLLSRISPGSSVLVTIDHGHRSTHFWRQMISRPDDASGKGCEISTFKTSKSR